MNVQNSYPPLTWHVLKTSAKRFVGQDPSLNISQYAY